MRLKFSLYLSAQLMFGTVKIYSNVSNYLLRKWFKSEFELQSGDAKYSLESFSGIKFLYVTESLW